MAWANDHARERRLPREWHRIRTIILKRDPVCRICHAAPSTHVDHLNAMTDDHRLEALQGLCAPCHASKTAADSHINRAPRTRTPKRHPGLI